MFPRRSGNDWKNIFNGRTLANLSIKGYNNLTTNICSINITIGKEVVICKKEFQTIK